MRKDSFVIVAIATLVLGTHFASAQSEPSLRHGVERLVAGDSTGALAEFQRVYDQTHSAVALAQMGLAEQALERWAEAETHIRLALAVQGDPWVEQQREALTSTYAAIRQHIAVVVVVQDTSSVVTPPPLPERAVEHIAVGRTDRHMRDESSRRSLLPLATGAGAAVLLGIGFVGIAMRESIAVTYNANCRGFGDPSPASGCDESTNASRANAAAVFGATGLIAGGLLGVVTAVLAARSQSHSGLALHCGGGPGDVGISCGGVL